MINRKLRKILILTAVLLAFAATAVVSSAYFSDYEVASGKAVIRLGGNTEVVEEIVDNNKDVSITNTGEGSVFVRVAIYGPKGMKVTPGDNWINGNDGFWYYKGILKKDDKTTVIKAEIGGIPPKDAANSEFDIIVVHESVPAAYKDDGKTVKVPEDWYTWTDDSVE